MYVYFVYYRKKVWQKWQGMPDGQYMAQLRPDYPAIPKYFSMPICHTEIKGLLRLNPSLTTFEEIEKNRGRKKHPTFCPFRLVDKKTAYCK